VAAQLAAYFSAADDDLLDVVGQWIDDGDVHSDDNDDVDQRFHQFGQRSLCFLCECDRSVPPEEADLVDGLSSSALPLRLTGAIRDDEL